MLKAVEKSQIFPSLVAVGGAAFAIYHLLQAFVVTQSTITLHVIHTLGAILVVCLTSMGVAFVSSKRWSYRLIFLSLVMILAVGCLIYVWTQLPRLESDWPWISSTDVVIGFLLFFAVLVVTWVAWGPLLSIVGALGILYFLFGQYVPGLLGHPGVSVPYAASWLGMSASTGMFWLIEVSATVIFPLIVFGLLIRATRAVEAFTELMKAAGRISKVAPVYACVLESGLVGMVSGGPSENVVLTGSATIPAMKGIGLRPETAGGLEAIASTGSQIVPPIMGLAAFLMAQLIGVPYVEVMLAAVIPAVLYYGALVVSAYFVATNELGDSVVKVGKQVDWGKVWRLFPTFIIPLAIVIGLLVKGFSPLFAASLGAIAVVVLSQTQGRYRPSLIDIGKGLRDGAALGSQIAVLLMSVGFLGQALMTTGVAVRLGRFLSMIIGESFGLSLILLMFVSLLIGMGAPTVVAYILAAVAVVPTVQNLGVNMMGAHFFAFYFATFSHITPPVAAGVVTASQLAGSRFLPTAWQAVKLSWPLFLVPFVFTFYPELLELTNMSFNTGLAILVYLLTVVSGVGSVWGGLPSLRIGIIGRVVLAAAAVLGISYIFTGSVVYLVAMLVTSLVGWGIPFLRRRVAGMRA